MAIDFPDSPSVNDTYVAGGKTYKWDGTAWEIYGPNFNPDILYTDTTNNRVGINNTSPSVDLDVTGDAAISGNLDVIGEFTSRGYRYVQTVYFTSSGTFTKATYPWLRAIRIKAQGAGGSGGCRGGAIGNPDPGTGGGGGGGAYAETWITDIAGLSSSETVTVGAGGAASSSTAGNSSAGGSSSFASLCVAAGGGASVTGGRSGGLGGTTGTGDVIFAGQDGEGGLNGISDYGGSGGSAFLGGGAHAPYERKTGNGANGYGGGGSGATDSNTSGAGANGIVIVELYA